MPKRTAEMEAMQHSIYQKLVVPIVYSISGNKADWIHTHIPWLFNLACLGQLFMTGSRIATGQAVQLLEIYLCLKIMHAASSA